MFATFYLYARTNKPAESETSTEDSSQPVATKAAIETDYQTILTESELNVWLEKLKAAELFAFDTETTSINYIEAELVGFSFAVKAGEAAYLPFGHDYPDAPEQLSKELVLVAFKPILEDDNKRKVCI